MDPKSYYNNKISRDKEYERERWFENDIKKSGYVMTREAILSHIKLEKFSSCLELGPGAGTWTKEMIALNPEAKIDLVDISGEMLGLCKKRFYKNKNLRYFESDFLRYETEKKYDLFFSSRALEYITDKEVTMKKIYGLLRKDGVGIIITKTPKYLRNKILMRRVSDFHSGQVAPRKLRNILKTIGFENIEIYPATVSSPVFCSAKMNLMLFKLLSKYKLNFFSEFFSESYLIKFRKK
ncbi:MAG: class I SAM-dependent methyltransferase [bacterium]